MTVSVSFSFVCCVYHLWKGTKSCHQGEQWTSSPLFGWCYLVLLSTAAGLTWPGITYYYLVLLQVAPGARLRGVVGGGGGGGGGRG